MRILIAWMFLCATAGADAPTIDEVAKDLDLDGPAVPFQVLSTDPFTSKNIKVPENAVAVEARLSVAGDPPFQNQFILRSVDGKPATAANLEAWFTGLKVDEASTLTVGRCRRTPDKRYKVESEKVKVVIQSNAAHHRALVVASKDPANKTETVGIVDEPWNLSLTSVRKDGGTPRLLLRAKHNGPKFLNTTELRVVSGDVGAAVPVPKQSRVQSITDGGNALEAFVVDVTDNPALHLVMIVGGDDQKVILRFKGDRADGENSISPGERRKLESVVAVHYADRFGK